MRLAVLSESEADEAALEAILGALVPGGIELETKPRLTTRGWPSVKDITPSVIKHVHYQTAAEGLVVVVDSNDSEIHDLNHAVQTGASSGCRLCQMRAVVNETLATVSPVPGKGAPLVAIGLAVPAIEAWYRCGEDPHVTEAAWIQARAEGRYPYTRRSLKSDVYGSTRYSRLERAREAGDRLAVDLSRLQQDFPSGFGTLYAEVSTWHVREAP